MMPNGDIIRISEDEEKPAGAIEITEKQAETFKKEPKRVRKNWMKNKPCVCGSKKKFKKCCWNKFKP